MMMRRAGCSVSLGLRKATALVLGENILRAIQSAVSAIGFPAIWSRASAQELMTISVKQRSPPSGQSTADTGVTRYRPHTVQQSGTDDGQLQSPL
jgi:hypothetical protein